MKAFKYALAGVAVAALVACGGGGGGSSGTTVAATDTTVGITAANGVQVVSALEALALNYTGGVTDFGTAAPTTLTIANTNTATPTFNIGSGGFVATGDMTFGSCRFKINTSTFPGGHPLSVGQTITVDPCQLVADTSGQTTGVPVETDVQLVLNGARPEPRKLPITITPAGDVQIQTPSGNTISLGTISVTTVTGGS